MNDKFSEILNIVSGTNNALGELSFSTFLLLLVVSLITSLFIARLYLYFYQGKSSGSEIYRAFPLLGLSVTAIFICIQFSLPLSLGLLGALSIVRFRTPIKEPEEIGFIMLIIAAAIATATFNLLFLALLLIVATGGLLFLHTVAKGFPTARRSGVIVVTMQSNEYDQYVTGLEQFFDKTFRNTSTDSVMENGSQIITTRIRRINALFVQVQQQLITG